MKKIKAWAVVWENDARKIYSVKEKDNILPLTLVGDEDINLDVLEKGLRGYLPKFDRDGYEVDSQAIFKRKQDAQTFKDGNKDFKIVPCTITY